MDSGWTAADVMGPPGRAGMLTGSPPVHAHPDQPFEIVLERLAQSPGTLPVVGREDTTLVLGAITLDDIVRFISTRRSTGP